MFLWKLFSVSHETLTLPTEHTGTAFSAFRTPSAWQLFREAISEHTISLLLHPAHSITVHYFIQNVSFLAHVKGYNYILVSNHLSLLWHCKHRKAETTWASMARSTCAQYNPGHVFSIQYLFAETMKYNACNVSSRFTIYSNIFLSWSSAAVSILFLWCHGVPWGQVFDRGLYNKPHDVNIHIVFYINHCIKS